VFQRLPPSTHFERTSPTNDGEERLVPARVAVDQRTNGRLDMKTILTNVKIWRALMNLAVFSNILKINAIAFF